MLRVLQHVARVSAQSYTATVLDYSPARPSTTDKRGTRSQLSRRPRPTLETYQHGPTSTGLAGEHGCANNSNKDDMLYYALAFLILALIAGAVGFGGVIASSAAGVAKLLCMVFGGLAAAAFAIDYLRRP